MLHVYVSILLSPVIFRNSGSNCSFRTASWLNWWLLFQKKFLWLIIISCTLLIIERNIPKQARNSFHSLVRWNQRQPSPKSSSDQLQLRTALKKLWSAKLTQHVLNIIQLETGFLVLLLLILYISCPSPLASAGKANIKEMVSSWNLCSLLTFFGVVELAPFSLPFSLFFSVLC